MHSLANSRPLAILPAALTMLLGACADDSDSDRGADAIVESASTGTARFEVSVVNLTAGQPLSPAALIAHADGYALFNVGTAASVGLEIVAEEGDSERLLDDVADRMEVLSTTRASDPLPPGGSTTLALDVATAEVSGLRLSLVAMLVNSNDAFTGLNGARLGDLAVGESRSLSAIAYDAGTEANSEAAGSIPGPADGGEGYNSERDDGADRVLMHGGVLTADGGLDGSVLREIHRWDNPVARFSITRTR